MGESQRVRYIAELQRRGGQALCRALNVRVQVKGDIPGDKAMLIVSNHPGSLDPWVLASCFPVAFAAKSEMGKWPVFGWVGNACGLIYVDRERRMNTTDFIEQVRKRMRNGVCVLVFPEGTTSDGSKLLTFKTGGFEAVSDMPDGFVLPVYMWPKRVNGERTSDVTRGCIDWPDGVSMMTNGWQLLGLRSVEIEVIVGKPVSTADMDRKQLARIAQDQVEALRRSTLSTTRYVDIN